MALTYGFYNAINHDRTYDAVQMSSIFDGIIRDGIFATIGTSFIATVTGDDMYVNVGIGRAWFNHTWTLNDAIMPVEVEQSEVVLDRIDALVLEINSDDQTRANAIKIIKGTPSSEPVAPEMEHTLTLNQYRLANIYVEASVTEILQENITNFVGTDETPFVTGPLEVISTSEIIRQWQNQWDNWFNATVAYDEQWFNQRRAAFIEWSDEYTENFELWAEGQRSAFESWSTEEKAAFEAWEETIRNILDQGAAGHLQNEIDAIYEMSNASVDALFDADY